MAALAASLAAAAAASDSGGYRLIPAGSYASVLPASNAQSRNVVSVVPFQLQRHPVTQGEFLSFIRAHGEWRRDRISRLFAEREYLASWSSPITLGESVRENQPVTQVSWFAAQAYCEAHGARLPTWAEYEYVLAASETQRDARGDPTWRERMLSWYSRPSTAALAPVGQTPLNVYGVGDLHGLVWEWVLDFNSLLVSTDNREQGDADRFKFCGSGALAVTDRENYPVLMRLAMLSALEAPHTTRNLGFRCARDLGSGAP